MAMSRIGAVAVVPFLVAAVGCGAGSQDPGEETGGVCPLVLVYRSHTYYPYQTEKPVEPGRPLDEVRNPPCEDSGGGQVDSAGRITDEQALGKDAADSVRAYTIAGIDPADAFVVPVYRRTLFFSGADGTAMPPEIEQLLKH
jgi:Family of unknown function (DUF6281)